MSFIPKYAVGTKIRIVKEPSRFHVGGSLNVEIGTLHTINKVDTDDPHLTYRIGSKTDVSQYAWLAEESFVLAASTPGKDCIF